MKTDHSGAIAFLAGCAIAAFGLLVWQDWWMLSIAVGGAVVWLLTTRQVSTGRALMVGAALGGSVLLVMTGVFLVVMGALFGGAVPGTRSSGVPGPVLAGLVALVAAVTLAVVGVRAGRHVAPRDER